MDIVDVTTFLSWLLGRYSEDEIRRLVDEFNRRPQVTDG